MTRPDFPEEYKKYAKTVPGSAGAISETAAPTETAAEGEAAADTEKKAIDTSRVYIPSHDHDNSAEGGLIAVCVIIWIAVAILIIVFFYQYCKEKKANASIAYEVQ